MRIKTALLAMCILGLNLAVADVRFSWDDHDCGITRIRNAEIDIEGKTVIIRERHDDEYVEITRDYDLYINGRRIRTRGVPARLTREYYEKVMDIRREARRIGLEGAEIGMEGAAMGIKAVAGLFKLLDPDFSTRIRQNLKSNTEH